MIRNIRNKPGILGTNSKTWVTVRSPGDFVTSVDNEPFLLYQYDRELGCWLALNLQTSEFLFLYHREIP